MMPRAHRLTPLSPVRHSCFVFPFYKQWRRPIKNKWGTVSCKLLGNSCTNTQPNCWYLPKVAQSHPEQEKPAAHSEEKTGNAQ